MNGREIRDDEIKKIEEAIGAKLKILSDASSSMGRCWITKNYEILIMEVDEDVVLKELKDEDRTDEEKDKILNSYNIAKSKNADFIISFSMDTEIPQLYWGAILSLETAKIHFVLHRGHYIDCGSYVHFLADEPVVTLVVKDDDMIKDYRYLKSQYERISGKKMSFSDVMSHVISIQSNLLRKEKKRKNKNVDPK